MRKPQLEPTQRCLGAKAKKRRLPPEEHHGELPMLILQREIEVSGGSAAQIGDFAFDPAVGIGSLDVAADLCDEFPDSPDAPRFLRALGWREKQSQLVYRVGARVTASLVAGPVVF